MATIDHSEAKKHVEVLMSDTFCRGCHMPQSLDEKKLCEFCRRVRNSDNVAATFSDRVPLSVQLTILAVMIGIGILIAAVAARG